MIREVDGVEGGRWDVNDLVGYANDIGWGVEWSGYGAKAIGCDGFGCS